MFDESTYGDYRILISGEDKGDQYNKKSDVFNVQYSYLIWLSNWPLDGKNGIQNSR